MVKNIMKEENLDLIGLTKTKHTDVSQWELWRCWGHQFIDFMQVTTIGGSEGLILTWHQEAFTLLSTFARQRWLCIIGKFQKTQISCAICLLYAPSEHYERL